MFVNIWLATFGENFNSEASKNIFEHVQWTTIRWIKIFPSKRTIKSKVFLKLALSPKLQPLIKQQENQSVTFSKTIIQTVAQLKSEQQNV